MLTRIVINNINAIEHCDISFARNKYQYLEDMVFHDKLVNPIAIYGTNGSGKSSLLNAISYLISLFVHAPDDMAQFVPNNVLMAKLIKQNSSKDKQLQDKQLQKVLSTFVSSIELYFTLNGDDYRYYIESRVLPFTITSEKLYVNEREILIRDEKSCVYNGEKTIVTSERFPIVRSIAKDENSSYVKSAYDFISNMAFIDANNKDYLHKTLIEKRSFDLLVEKSKEVNDILKKYKEFPLYNISLVTSNDLSAKYYLDLNIENNDYVRMPLQFISTGMQNNSMMLSLLLSLPENGVLLVDEIENALHPLTIMDFLSIVKKKNIQLIFSSHNTFLLQKLRPDQIFFAHWSKGSSKYKRLSDIYPNIRAINNIEKMYLANLFEEDIKK